MRVAVVVSTYPPYPGGMGNAAASHVEALKAAGHEVAVFSPGAGLRPLFRVGNSACAPQLWWKLRGFDAVELHYPFFGGAEWVWLWKRTFGRRKRLAVMYHMDAVGAGLFGAIFRLYRALFLKPILRAADVVLTASRDYLASSQAAFIKDDARVRETPFGVDTERFRPRPDIAKQEPLALFVGGLDRAHYFKGVPVLLEAFALALKAVPEARLAIVGDGDMRAAYERKALELGIEKRVWFVGKAPDAHLQECYGHARVHVLPSIDRSEAFGIVTLEAAACGVPSVVSDLPGVRTLVEEGVTGTRVPPGDAAALSRALTDFLVAKDRAEAMGRAARERALRLYARNVVDRALVEALTA
ncbi:MAG TPA: glycosyltransferase family 4 protein [Patescibacteria group bacterium]|nr:glycosyltransferase family 4 protein [Patescibacteria group bacterium]